MYLYNKQSSISQEQVRETFAPIVIWDLSVVHLELVHRIEVFLNYNESSEARSKAEWEVGEGVEEIR